MNSNFDKLSFQQKFPANHFSFQNEPVRLITLHFVGRTSLLTEKNEKRLKFVFTKQTHKLKCYSGRCTIYYNIISLVSLITRNFSAISRAILVTGERKSAGFPLLFYSILIRMNNYLPSITFHRARLCLKTRFTLLEKKKVSALFPFCFLQNPLSFVSLWPQLKSVINHCQKSERSYTFQALEGLCHWMLNLQPIM
jgi:hypothetical protein